MAAGSNQRKLELKDLPIVRRLGQGHSGYLYETEWSGKRYARKDFPLGSVELNNLFETEIQPLFNLDHPNIVKCVGYTLGKSSCSLVQEYVKENLQNTIQSRIDEQRKTSSRSTSTGTRVLDVDEIKRLVSSRGKKKETATTNEGSSRCPRPTPFEGPEAISIIAQIASAMEYLHENQVAHGDLKPRNVLVYSESGERKVKLVDFGLSEIKKRISLVSERSRHVEILTWKAPECLEEEVLGPSIGDSNEDRDKSETDLVEEIGEFSRSKLALADVYNFGLTCLFILGGKLGYPDMSLTKLRERRTRDSILKLPSACPQQLKSIIGSCLEFDPWCRSDFTTIFSMLAHQLYVASSTTPTPDMVSFSIAEHHWFDEVAAHISPPVSPLAKPYFSRLEEEITDSSAITDVIPHIPPYKSRLLKALQPHLASRTQSPEVHSGQDEAAMNRILAERRRRVKQKENFAALRRLVPIISKADKAQVLGDTIVYLKDLQGRIEGLEMNLAETERRYELLEKSYKELQERNIAESESRSEALLQSYKELQERNKELESMVENPAKRRHSI